MGAEGRSAVFLGRGGPLSLLGLLAVLAALAAVGGACSSGQEGDGEMASRYERIDLRRITDDGGRVDWSPDGEIIYFDRLMPDGFWDLWQMRADGSEQRCLTCDQPALPNKHQGQPAAHPSGRYLLFQAEKAEHWGEMGAGWTVPGGGVFNDLWVLDLETGSFHRLTDVRPDLPAGGSLHANFSPDGRRLVWSDLLGGGPDEFGRWRIAVADFVPEPTPHLENVTYYQPGEQQNWYETHDWSPDGRSILFTAATLPGQNTRAMDIYRLHLSSGDATRLTETSGLQGEPAEWEELAHFSPRGDAIVWMSSRGYGIDTARPWPEWLRTELWMMNADGSDKWQVTHFNDPGHPDYQGQRVIVAENAWSPDGAEVAMLVWFPESSRPFQIWVVEFAAPAS